MSAQLLPASLRDDFPVLSRLGPSGRPLIYLDSAATTLKPRTVIDAVANVMANGGGNVHRAVHMLGDEITEQFEQARGKVAGFIGAQPHETVFVRNTTEGLNLVARCLRRTGRVLLSSGEHHSGLLPWTGEVQRLPPQGDGQVDEEALLRELGRGGVGVVVVSHVSNVTGHRVNVRLLADAAHAAGAILVLDGAQSVPHGPLDVSDLGCDFLAFSSHKMCGPSGIGALFGRAELLAEMKWHLHGGGTVESVRQGQPLPRDAPWRFEAGTPAIEAAVGFGAAVDYLLDIGPERLETHSRFLCRHARDRLKEVSGVRVVGSASPSSTGPLSFAVSGVPSHLISRTLSDVSGICVRSGFHCAEPLHEAMQLPPTVRLSFYLYNQPEEIDAVFAVLAEVLAFCRR
jgi:cysteine desulfurase / selenocysteine lyase